AEIERHLAALESAIARIEGGFKIEHPPSASRKHLDGQPSISAVSQRQRRGIALAGAAIVLGLVVGAVYLLYPANKQAPSAAREQRKVATAPEQKAEAVAVDNDKASYILRKQRTFYRTTHPAGTLIVSRSQRFLYLVQPSQVAIRYAIGVGPDCESIAG